MRTLGGLPSAAKVGIWLGAVAVSGVAGLLVLGATYDEFLDCSNPEIHESADTALGWTIAVVATLLPVGLAVWLAGGVARRLPALAAAVAVVSLVVWWWVLAADCEWYALPPS